MSRKFVLMALTGCSLALAAGRAGAQDPGLIHYAQDPSLYRISGNGGPAIAVQGAPSSAGSPSDLTYDGRHRYIHSTQLGKIPGTDPNRNFAYGDFYLWDEVTGASIRLTGFRGPVYTQTYFSRTRWSNDRLDSFLSFFTWDTTTGLKHVVRARVSAAEIVALGDSFTPFTAADLGGRLEIAATWSSDRQIPYTWYPDGGSLIILDRRLDGQFKLRAHPVGDRPLDADPILWDERVTGLTPWEPDISPDATRLVFRAESNKGGKLVQPGGLIQLDLATGAWAWLIQDAGKTGLSGAAAPAFAPDGTGLAFGARRLRNGQIQARGLYKISLLDGSITTLKEVSSSSPALFLRRWTR